MFTYENNNNRTYLVYQFEPNDVVDEFVIGMITNNKMYNLVPAFHSRFDNKRMIKYDITSRVSANQIFSRMVSAKVLLGLIISMVDAALELQAYMISEDMLYFDMQYMYTDITNGKTVFLCLPVAKESKGDLVSFIRGLIIYAQYDKANDTYNIPEILKYLNATIELNLTDFKRFLTEMSSSKSNAPYISESPAPVQPVIQQSDVTVKTPPVYSEQQSSERFAAGNNFDSSKSAANQSIPDQAKNQEKHTSVAEPQSAQSAAADEKPMTMFYLLQHYNKENAALYKAQKEAKKARKAASASVPVQTPAHGMAIPSNTSASAKFSHSSSDFNKQPMQIPGQNNASATPSASYNNSFPPVSTPDPNSASAAYASPAGPFASVQTPPAYYQNGYSDPSIEYAETTILGNDVNGETVVLTNEMSSAPPRRAYIVRLKNNERILLHKAVFRLGKERNFVDYHINDNEYVSRSHANILQRDDHYYIIDNNSLNHTYVNGNPIISNTEVELKSGDTFSLANEDFEFKLI